MASAAIQLGSNILMTGLAELTQHSARLKDAKNENAAAQAAITAFDQDVQQVAQQLQAGQLTPAAAIAFCENEDAQIEKYLQAQVGKPGTAWDGTGVCSKTCTVGCCIYYGYIHGGFVNTINAITQLQQSGQPVSHTYVAIATNKYGLQGRASFTVTFSSIAASPGSSLIQSVSSAIGLSSTATSSSFLLLYAIIAIVIILLLTSGGK